MLLSNNINAFEYLENGLMDPSYNLSLIGKWSENNSFLLSPFNNQYTLNWLINAFDALFHHFSELKHIRIPKKSWQKDIVCPLIFIHKVLVKSHCRTLIKQLLTQCIKGLYCKD